MGKISIILSGGASKGGLEAGMLKAILEKYRYDQIEVITGTSVGALNGAMVAQHKFEELLEIWRGIRSWKDIYRKWFFGYLEGFFRGGLVNFAPMEKIVEDNITEDIFKSPIKYYSCSVDLFNRKKMYYGNHNLDDINLLRKGIIASASMAPHFRPVEINGNLHTDGGVREPIPVKQAVDVAEETDLFFVLLTKKAVYSRGDSIIGSNMVAGIERIIGCLSDEVWDDDITVGSRKYWGEDKFIVIEPDKSNVTNFDTAINQENIQKDIQQGYQKAKEAMQARGLW